MMKTKQFLVVLISIISVSVVLLVFGENKPDAIQNIVSSTHQQIRSFKVSCYRPPFHLFINEFLTLKSCFIETIALF